MSERYTRVYESHERQYLEEGSLVLLASAILKDSQTDKAVGQLKFENLGKPIVSMTVLLTGSDPFGKTLFTDFAYNYLDLNVGRHDIFGSKTPIILPDNNVRSIDIKVSAIVCKDGEILRIENPFVSIPEGRQLEAILSDAALHQYHDIYGKDKTIEPEQFRNLWICGCGTVNTADEELCHNCGKSFDELTSGLNLDFLEKESTYRAAIQFMSSGEKEDLCAAEKKFRSISGYKDADSQAEECVVRIQDFENEIVYQEVCRLEKRKKAENYQKASELLSTISGYKDADIKLSADNEILKDILEKEEKKNRRKAEKKKKKRLPMVLKITITIVLLAAAAGAGFFFIYLPSRYNTAVNYFNNKYYDLAAPEFEALYGYNDSKDLADLSKYRYIQQHYKDDRTDLMYTFFESLEQEGYPMDEAIVNAIKRYTVKVFITPLPNMTVNAKTISQSANAIYVNYTCVSGYKDKELPVKLVIYKGDEEVRTFDDLTISAGSTGMIELDQEFRNELGFGIIKAALFDEEGKLLGNCATVITSQ